MQTLHFVMLVAYGKQMVTKHSPRLDCPEVIAAVANKFESVGIPTITNICWDNGLDWQIVIPLAYRQLALVFNGVDLAYVRLFASKTLHQAPKERHRQLLPVVAADDIQFDTFDIRDQTSFDALWFRVVEMARPYHNITVPIDPVEPCQN